MAIEMARLTQTIAQSVPSVSDTLVQFDSLAFDTTSGRMPSVANNNLLCSTSGAYLVTGSIRFAPQNNNLNISSAGARIRNTNAQGIANATDTQMVFNVADMDQSVSNQMTSFGANALTAVHNGVHVITGHIRYQGGGAGAGGWYAGIRLNGSIVIGGANSVTSAAGGFGEVSVAHVVYLNQFDTVQLWGWQGTGFGQNTEPGFGGVTLAMVGPLNFGGSERYLSIWKNGSTSLRQAESNNVVFIQPGAINVATICQLNQGDTVDLRCFHHSDTTPISTDPGFGDIHLSMALLSPA